MALLDLMPCATLADSIVVSAFGGRRQFVKERWRLLQVTPDDLDQQVVPSSSGHLTNTIQGRWINFAEVFRVCRFGGFQIDVLWDVSLFSTSALRSSGNHRDSIAIRSACMNGLAR